MSFGSLTWRSLDIIAYADCFNIQSLFNAPKGRIEEGTGGV